MQEQGLTTLRSEGGDPAPGARVSTILARALIEAVEASGTTVADFMHASGFSAQQLEAAYGWLDTRELDRLIEHAVAITGDAAFGLHWTERSPMMKFDLLATATAYAPTLREALSCVLRFQELLCEQREVELIERPDSVLLRFTPVVTTELAARVRAELGISGLMRLVRHVGAPEDSVLGVTFGHAAPAYAGEYLRLLGSRVHFGQPCTSLELDPAWLDRSVHHANPELHQLLSRQATEVLTRVRVRASCAERLRDYLRRVFPRLPEMREAARALSLSERSLRRRLVEEGWSYSGILDEMRQLLARQLLTNSTRPISEIAAEVGFTNSAAFFRAFKRWTGESPGVYRSTRPRFEADALGDANATREAG